MAKYYLGLSVTYHDPAFAIVNGGGDALFAEATERPLQNKRALNNEPDQLFYIPELLQRFCADADSFVIAINWRRQRPLYESALSRLGFLTAKRLLQTGIKKLRAPLVNYQLHHMMACQHNSIARAGLNLARILHDCFPGCPVAFADFDHHLTHAALACYSSPFSDAACAVADSFGEHGALAFYRFRSRRLETLHIARGIATASIGLYYMKITELCGFDWQRGEEWKVMGLAGYGQFNQELYDILQSTVTIDGFDCRHRTGDFFANLDRLNQFKRPRDAPPEQAADTAFTGQIFFADLMTRLLAHLHAVTGIDNLALAGGCALNSSYNGRIAESTPFRQVHVPPAPADDGCALGAAWLACRRDRPKLTIPPRLLSPYLGSSMDQDALQRLLVFNCALSARHCPETLYRDTAKLLAEGNLVGWLQGRAEFGPRALGNRSILADPRDAYMQDRINQTIKFRERFRPFAPAVLDECGGDYFEHYQSSPYMDKTLRIKPHKRAQIAAVCHVDGTGRVQTVKAAWNPRFHRLIQCFYELTGVPLLLNTSFNVMGKPLAHSIEDAVAVFMTSGLDVLVIDDYLISKKGHD